MTLLQRLSGELPERYYLGLDVGYEEHGATVISFTTFARGDDRWKRARCIHVPTTQTGLNKLQRYLERFSPDPTAFLGLCEPTGGYYGATVFQYLLDQGYPMMWVDNATVTHMREKIFSYVAKTDELDTRVTARGPASWLGLRIYMRPSAKNSRCGHSRFWTLRTATC